MKHSKPTKANTILRELAALSWSGLDIDSAAWIRLGAFASEHRSKAITMELLERCEEYGWPLDKSGLALYARLCRVHRLGDKFLSLVISCNETGWPLDELGWIAFFRASETLRIVRAHEEVLLGCDTLGWPLADAGWRAWLRLTRFRGDDCVDRGVHALITGLPSFRTATIASILKIVADLQGSPDLKKAERARLVLRRIWSSRKISAWTISDVHFASIMRAARALQDRELMASIAEELVRENEAVASLNEVIAFSIAWFKLSGGTEVSAKSSLAVLSAVQQTFRADRPAAARIQLLSQAFTAISPSSHQQSFGAYSLLPAHAEELGFEIAAGDFNLIAAAVDQGSLKELLGTFDVAQQGLSQDQQRETRHKLRALLKYVGRISADSSAFIQLGQLHRNERDFALAMEFFQQAELVAKGNELRAAAAYEMGLTMLDQGKSQQALPLLLRSIELNGKPHLSAYAKAAEAAKRSGKYDIARHLLETLIVLQGQSDDVRAHLQLANTIVDGVRREQLPANDLERINEIGMAIFDKSEQLDERVVREAAMVTIEALALNARISKRSLSSHPVLTLLAGSPLPILIDVICDALIEHGVWLHVVIDTLLTRILERSDERVTFSALVGCLSAAMAAGYHNGSLADQPYVQAVARIFRRILRSGVANKRRLLFELFVARREHTLQLMLAQYAAMAERVVAVFLRPAIDEEAHPEFEKTLIDINRLLAEEMPAGLKPEGYGSTDVVSLAPRIAQFISRLNVRAAISDARGEVTLRDPAEARSTHGLQLEWMRIRASIASLIPVALESPFAQIARVSVPWLLEIECRPGQIIAAVHFPSGIHPQHQPESLLGSAAKAIQEWSSAQPSRGLEPILDLSNWREQRRARVAFGIAQPSQPSALNLALEAFTAFAAAETKRTLQGGTPSATFFTEAWQMFERCDTSLLLQGDGWLTHYHQHLMDVHFVTTAEWLFIGESLAETREKPDYHPRYEVHSLKTYVSSAIADIQRNGAIDAQTLDDLRHRLVAMRRNILQALRQVTGAVAGDPKSPTDVVGAINDVVTSVPRLGNGESVEIATTGPLYLLARADAPALHAALSNLLLNAMEAVSEADVDPLITVAVEVEDVNWLAITVSNRFDEASTKKAHGFGLGIRDTRFHIETVNGGTLQHGPTENGWYLARIRLQRWIHAA